MQGNHEMKMLVIIKEIQTTREGYYHTHSVIKMITFQTSQTRSQTKYVEIIWETIDNYNYMGSWSTSMKPLRFVWKHSEFTTHKHQAHRTWKQLFTTVFLAMFKFMGFLDYHILQWLL